MSADVTGLIWSYIYASSLLVISELLVRFAGWPQFVTRKLVHIGAGMWVWGILYFFEHWYLGIIPFATFIVLNWVIYKYGLLKGVDKEDSSPGTIYFAFSITVLFLLFWRTGSDVNRVALAVAPIMAMTWGDGLASLVGKTLGRHPYSFFGHTRTWEGSAVMLGSSVLAIKLSMVYLGQPIANPTLLLAALTATAAEAVAPAGTDNLSVPLLTAGVLWILI